MLQPIPTSLELLELSAMPCAICGSTSFEPLAQNDRNLLGIVTVGCNNCGLLQTNPRPSAKGLDLFYRDHYRMYYQGTHTPDQVYIAGLNKDVRLAYTASYLSAASRMPPRDVSILDYGCGEGSLFSALRKVGFEGQFFGVELNANFGEFAGRHGAATVVDAISKTDPVDVIILNHVLEHLADPIKTLVELSTKLKPQGCLYIDVPDAEEYSSIQDIHIAHIFHFTVRTLQRLVQEAGFAVTVVEKHAPPCHPHSIRLLAARGSPTQALVSEPAREKAAWAAVRRVGRLRNTFRLRLRKISIAHSMYHLGKKLIGRRRAAGK